MGVVVGHGLWVHGFFVHVFFVVGFGLCVQGFFVVGFGVVVVVVVGGFGVVVIVVVVGVGVVVVVVVGFGVVVVVVVVDFGVVVVVVVVVVVHSTIHSWNSVSVTDSVIRSSTYTLQVRLRVCEPNSPHGESHSPHSLQSSQRLSVKQQTLLLGYATRHSHRTYTDGNI